MTASVLTSTKSTTPLQSPAFSNTVFPHSLVLALTPLTYLSVWTSEVLYVINIVLIKIALVCFFLRIFPQRRFLIACYCLIAGTAISALIWMALLIFQCAPISAGWDINVAAPKCYNIQVFAYVGAAIAMVQDVAVLVFPIPILLKLRVTMRKKLGVLALFSLGILYNPFLSFLPLLSITYTDQTKA